MHCETHAYHTRHKSETYILHCKTLKDALLSRIPKLQVLINVVPPNLQDHFYSPEDPKWQGAKPIGRYRFPRVGAFEVVVKGRSVFSKLESGRWPPHARVVDWVNEVLEGLEPDTRPPRPQTREVKSRGGKRYTSKGDKGSAPTLHASASHDNFPPPKPRERTPSPPMQHRELPSGDPYRAPDFPETPPGYKESQQGKSQQREEFVSPSKPDISGKGSLHEQFPPRSEVPYVPIQPRTLPVQEDHSKDTHIPSPVHPDPPVHSSAAEVPKVPEIPPAASEDYQDDFPPASQPSAPEDSDPRQQIPADAREEDEDLDALVPETDFTDEMNLAIPLGHASSHSLQQENTTDQPQKVTLRSSNPAVLVLPETSYTVPPGQTIDMRLDIAASEAPGVKQCVLYIAVDGKVTDCVLLNIDYKTLEELAEEEEEEEEPAQEVFAFTIPVDKKVKKV